MELAGLDPEAHGNNCYRAWSVPKIFDPVEQGSTPVTLV